MKKIINTVKDFIVGKSIPEKVLTLLCSGDEESIDLAFCLLDLDPSVHQSYTKKRHVKRLRNKLWKKGYLLQTIRCSASYPIKYSVRRLSAGEKYNYR